jgi:hypothetical protein
LEIPVAEMQNDLLELHLWLVVSLDFLAREILVAMRKKNMKHLSNASDELRTVTAGGTLCKKEMSGTSVKPKKRYLEAHRRLQSVPDASEVQPQRIGL